MFTAWLQLDYRKILCNFCPLEFTRGPNGKCFNQEFALAFMGKCYKFDFCYSAQQNQWIDKNIQMAVLTDLKMKNHNIICRPLN